MTNLYYKNCFLLFRDSSKEALLEHVREHSRADDDSKPKKSENTPDPADLAYRCGHCNQLSNWKHVIQVCVLKHIITKTCLIIKAIIVIANFFFDILITDHLYLFPETLSTEARGSDKSDNNSQTKSRLNKCE